MNIPPIDDMYRVAKQYSRRPEEVDDLVQDLLLEAVITGKDFSDKCFMAWGRGFLRNRAAFIARTEARRRKREERFHGAVPSPIVVFELAEGYMESVLEKLAGEGVEIVTPVTEAPGGWSSEFVDPDGHPLAFFQSGELPLN